MANPIAFGAAVIMVILAVVFAVKREDAPWPFGVIACVVLALLYFNHAFSTSTLSELTGECK